REVLEELSLLERQLQVRTQKAKVHDAHSRLLKRILIDERRHTAEAIDEPLQKAVDRGVIHQLMRETNKLEQFMEQPWFDSVEAMRLPKLTDYLSVRYAEESMEELYMEPRELDEKFHILEAPSLFLRDLAYYRIRCGLRDLPIAVAYMDIDDFKAFNTKYTETKVDLDLLTPFMETIEAHVFAHGHAYRFGGDEYLLLLPNVGWDAAQASLVRLQDRVSALECKGIRERVTISFGVVMVESDCILTDREVLAKANLAKNHAKTGEKDCIAYFDGPLHRPEDLKITRRSSR
ncbi:MAG: GGDEF domain-containing protein, partial [Myxococcales bacterium]|nr:GGDEF domain-containing protein [Myxococcales bacterium]